MPPAMFHTFLTPSLRSTCAAFPDLLPDRQSSMMSPIDSLLLIALCRKFVNLVSGIFCGGVSRP